MRKERRSMLTVKSPKLVVPRSLHAAIVDGMLIMFKMVVTDDFCNYSLCNAIASPWARCLRSVCLVPSFSTPRCTVQWLRRSVRPHTFSKQDEQGCFPRSVACICKAATLDGSTLCSLLFHIHRPLSGIRCCMVVFCVYQPV